MQFGVMNGPLGYDAVFFSTVILDVSNKPVQSIFWVLINELITVYFYNPRKHQIHSVSERLNTYYSVCIVTTVLQKVCIFTTVLQKVKRKRLCDIRVYVYEKTK
jgi:hypothetical protein